MGNQDHLLGVQSGERTKTQNLLYCVPFLMLFYLIAHFTAVFFHVLNASLGNHPIYPSWTSERLRGPRRLFFSDLLLCYMTVL